MIRAKAAEQLVSKAISTGEAAAWSATRTKPKRARAPKAAPTARSKSTAEGAPAERVRSETEIEFMEAMQAYKQSSGRMFPTWSEVLEVLQHLGYRKPGSPVGSSPAVVSDSK